MKILVVGARGIPNVEGGAEKNAECIFPLVAAAGHEVRLVSLKGMGAQDEFKGVKIMPAPRVTWLGTDKILALVYSIYCCIWYRPDIVHLQSLSAALLIGVYRAMGFKVIARYGSYDYELTKWGGFGSRVLRCCEWQLRWAHKVIAVTDALQERLAGKNIRNNIHIIPNASTDMVPVQSNSAGTAAELQNIMKEFGLEKGRFLLSVGRVTDQKNFVNLVQAFQEASPRLGRSLKLAIAGGLDDGEYVRQLRSQLDEQVVLTGRLPRDVILGLHGECMGYVSASIAEGNSNAILEAIACRTPMIVSDIPPNRDLQLADHHYFDPHSISAMASALETLVSNPQRFRAQGGRFEEWTWEKASEELIAVYRAILLGTANARR